MNHELLKVVGLTAGYGPVRVLHGLDLSVSERELVVVLGANGAGKTTTLRALCGLIRHAGEIWLEGRRVDKLRPRALVQAGMVMVPQGRGTFSELSVADNLAVGAYTRRDPKSSRADLERIYGYFPKLRERREQLAGQLSGGEQQMLAIARALMSRPRLLMLDEPSLGLAPVIVEQVFSLLIDINQEQGTGMLIVEQNAELALDIAQRGFVLEAGEIVLTDAAQGLRDNDAVRRAYLGGFEEDAHG